MERMYYAEHGRQFIASTTRPPQPQIVDGNIFNFALELFRGGFNPNLKICAIKLCRTAYRQVGLREAKMAVEAAQMVFACEKAYGSKIEGYPVE